MIIIFLISSWKIINFVENEEKETKRKICYIVEEYLLLSDRAG